MSISEDRFVKFTGIILAAGLSSRMQAWKPGIIIKDRPVIYYTLSPMLSVCTQIVIVGGYKFNALTELFNCADYLSEAQRKKIILTENSCYEKGMFSSVKSGLSLVDENSGGIFILPGDMPLVRTETYTKLIKCMENEADKDVIYPAVMTPDRKNPPEIRLKKGHPVLMRSRIRASVLKADEGMILRDVLKSFNSGICTTDDQGICFDVDEETDMKKAWDYIENKYPTL